MSVIGQVIGNYRIVSELGKGGMGMVYRAEHVQLGRPAALKMLLPQFSNDPAIVQRFFNEARAASAIDHPGIVEVYDFGTHSDGAAYIVMALLKGESLEHRLRRGPLALMEGASIVAQVLGALAAAHARGIVHRDLKPDNIFLTPNELMPDGIQVKLLDFGIAKLADDQGGAGFKTQTGMMMGTPAYMSPEQCMGKADLDHRTDLYAIGCILFHVLTGRPPFISDQGTGMMIASHIRDPAPHPRSINPNIPEPLAAIILRLLEKEPAARFQSAQEARQALVAIGASAPSKPPVAADVYAATMAPSPSQPPMMASTPTTQSGAAAQMVPLTHARPAKGKTGVIVGVVGLLAVLGGVGAFVALRGTGASQPTSKPDEPATPEVKPVEAKPAEVQPAGRPIEPASEAAQEPCPLGKVRGFDTHGMCCWPEQAFSTAKSRCVGAPACPPGHKVSAEDCVVEVAEAKPAEGAKPIPGAVPARPPHQEEEPASVRPADPMPAQPGSPAPTFKLDAKAYGPGDPINITFAKPVASSSRSRAWVTVVEAQKPDSQYGAWTYIDDGASTAKLSAPAQPGSYEVRLHTDYPTKSYNVRQKVALTVGAAVVKTPKGVTSRNDQRFMLASKTAGTRDHVELTFPVPMKAVDGEKFWVTVVQKGASDSSYGAYAYVPDGARTMQFEMPATAGDYEIRLHANYPRLSTNLVHRAPIRVED